ncbi:MAG: Asp-tRNA(Asn)/Glu-tRNA(Gln) amidotransferase subunit GatC [Desulfovibrionaceae bacterium]
MPISTDDVMKMASLARLRVDSPTQERFARQFGDILHYMDVLRSIDTNGVEPLYSPVQHTEATRPDVAVNVHNRREVLANAPHKHDTYFVVPRVV